jgi:hypothetical protein
VYGIKCRDKLWVEIQSVSLDKGERVIWLRLDIYSNNIKSRHTVTGSRTACATEQIKQSRHPPKNSNGISLSAFSGCGSTARIRNHA